MTWTPRNERKQPDGRVLRKKRINKEEARAKKVNQLLRNWR